MSLSLSKRSASIVQSEIRTMSIECEKVKGVNLSQGVCDMEVPLAVRQGAHGAIEQGINSYTRYDGLPELRAAISEKMERYNQIRCDPESQIVVSGGSTGAFYCACLALLNPGDEVILFEPYYGYHVNTLLAVEAVPTYVTMQPPDWTFTLADLEQAITARTRGIMINTPANPSGKVFSRPELQWILDCSVRHDLFVFTDEIYEYFLYDNLLHLSPGSLPGAAERTITISGFSKTYSITGWRIGYSISDPKWTQMIGYMNDLVYVCAPAPLQIGVARGIAELGEAYYRSLCAEFGRKREKICSALVFAGLTPYIPQGSYYILADVSRLPGATSKEKAMYLLRETGVASVPGEAFYHAGGGENLVRFCFAKTDEDLDDACDRLRRLA